MTAPWVKWFDVTETPTDRITVSTTSTPASPLQEWLTKHKDHGRAGPWRDANVHVYRRFVCPCGEVYSWTEYEEEKDPKKFVYAR